MENEKRGVAIIFQKSFQKCLHSLLAYLCHTQQFAQVTFGRHNARMSSVGGGHVEDCSLQCGRTASDKHTCTHQLLSPFMRQQLFDFKFRSAVTFHILVLSPYIAWSISFQSHIPFHSFIQLHLPVHNIYSEHHARHTHHTHTHTHTQISDGWT